MLRIPHCLDNRLIDGGKIVSPLHRPHSIPQKHLSVSCTDFCYRLSKPQGLVLPEGLGKLKKLINLIGSGIRDLPACSVVPSSTLQRAPANNNNNFFLISPFIYDL
jgi:hypothetical protein